MSIIPAPRRIRGAHAATIGATLLTATIGLSLTPSRAGAETWSVLPKSPDGCVTVSAFDENTVIGSLGGQGKANAFVKTADGGATWSAAALPVPGNLYWRDAMTGFVASVGVYRTTDGGKNWKPNDLGIAKPQTAAPTSVHCAGSICYAVGDKQGGTGGRLVVRSTDSGETWKETGVPASAMKLSQVWVFDDKIVLATGIKGPSNMGAGGWRSADGGATWQDVDAFGVYNTKIVDAKVAYTWNQKLLKTSDGALTWTPVTVPVPSGNPTGEVRTFDFLDANTGLIAFEKGDILRTVDGGATWTNEPLPAGWADPSSIVFASAKVAYASTFRIPGFGHPSVIRAGTPGASTGTPDAGSTGDTSTGIDAGGAADTGTGTDTVAATNDSAAGSDVAAKSDAASPQDATTTKPASTTSSAKSGGCSATPTSTSFGGWSLCCLALLALGLRRSTRKSRAC